MQRVLLISLMILLTSLLGLAEPHAAINFRNIFTRGAKPGQRAPQVLDPIAPCSLAFDTSERWHPNDMIIANIFRSLGMRSMNDQPWLGPSALEWTVPGKLTTSSSSGEVWGQRAWPDQIGIFVKPAGDGKQWTLTIRADHALLDRYFVTTFQKLWSNLQLRTHSIADHTLVIEGEHLELSVRFPISHVDAANELNRIIAVFANYFEHLSTARHPKLAEEAHKEGHRIRFDRDYLGSRDVLFQDLLPVLNVSRALGSRRMSPGLAAEVYYGAADHLNIGGHSFQMRVSFFLQGKMECDLIPDSELSETDLKSFETEIQAVISDPASTPSKPLVKNPEVSIETFASPRLNGNLAFGIRISSLNGNSKKAPDLLGYLASKLK